MQTILLVMKRKALAQGLMRKLQDNSELLLVHEPGYASADLAFRTLKARVTLIEVAESGECDVLYCLDLCARLRKETPGCKLLLMCPEQDKLCIEKAVQAKQEGDIDDFIFYDASIDYLASKLLSLQQLAG